MLSVLKSVGGYLWPSKNDEIILQEEEKELNEHLKILEDLNSDENKYEDITKSEDYQSQNSVKISSEKETLESDNCIPNEKVFIGKVICRNGRSIIMDTHNIKFNLDKVHSNFIPIIGDWIEVLTKIETKKDDFTNIEKILEITNVKCLRSATGNGIITSWDSDTNCGTIDDAIIIIKDYCEGLCNINIGDTVLYDAIESEQEQYTWRALSLVCILPSTKSNNKISNKTHFENRNGIAISTKFDLNDIVLGENKIISVKIKNNENEPKFFLKCIFLSRFKDSQIRIKSENVSSIIKPKESMEITFEIIPKFLGLSTEIIMFTFKGFKISRQFKITVRDSTWHKDSFRNKSQKKYRNEHKDLLLKYQDQYNRTYIPGVRTIKPPPFIKVKMPGYTIPKYLWDFVYNYTCEDLKIDIKLPELVNSLNISNYREKLHTLQYIEEIQNAIMYKFYDMDVAYMIRNSPYLRLDIDNLFELRPSLQLGDSVRVNNPWDPSGLSFEGFIHKINSNNVLLQFCNDFHNRYTGEAVSVEFHFSRSLFRKFHYAVDLCYSNLGVQILFPENIEIKDTQIEIKNGFKSNTDITDNTSVVNDLKKRNIIWFNKDLNKMQKTAVINILEGIARPLPYIIFGPPGTGKTITLIEVIMQIICLLPNSRLLIATPSNSAANLLTERLIKIGKFSPGFLVRLVSFNQISNQNFPAHLKPYTATINIGIEKSSKDNHHITEEGVDFDCSYSSISHQRIIIGTCACLGSLVRIGLPINHFTHVLVDEAGQTTETEIMIPLSFINKLNGQIILSGDPMQLGPVVISTIAQKYGFTLSYLERLIGCFPYQKDKIAYGTENGGYDSRLVTRLNYNYRSIQSIIELSSDFFYDNSLESKFEESNIWIKEYCNKLKGILEVDDCSGIIFYGIRGINYRGEDHPSWFNPHEGSMVMLFLCHLYKKQFQPEDIGIITPYIQQVKYIQNLITNAGLQIPKIGSVEEFQGQERKIIIMSTVRSQECYVNSDVEKHLGFVCHPKRVNVALTRAQILLVIFGNPHLLMIDPLWRKIINKVIKEEKYIGCNLPQQF